MKKLLTILIAMSHTGLASPFRDIEACFLQGSEPTEEILLRGSSDAVFSGRCYEIEATKPTNVALVVAKREGSLKFFTLVAKNSDGSLAPSNYFDNKTYTPGRDLSEIPFFSALGELTLDGNVLGIDLGEPWQLRLNLTKYRNEFLVSMRNLVGAFTQEEVHSYCHFPYRLPTTAEMAPVRDKPKYYDYSRGGTVRRKNFYLVPVDANDFKRLFFQ